MVTVRHVLLAIALALLLALALAVALTRPAAAEWQSELSEQIAEKHDCEVAFLSQVIVRDLDDRQLIMAKVHCLDRRSFDATREEAEVPFTFRICEERDVESC